MNVHAAASLFWLFVSVVVSLAAFRLDLGSFSSPGMGFLPFGAAVLLGLLSVISFLQETLKGERTGQNEDLFRGTRWAKVVLVLAALVIYAQTIPLAGYRISTFLLMMFLFWVVERQKMWKVIVLAFLATAITYYVFSGWLNCQFPTGPLGF